jgi:hypothetical protein
VGGMPLERCWDWGSVDRVFRAEEGLEGVVSHPRPLIWATLRRRFWGGTNLKAAFLGRNQP